MTQRRASIRLPDPRAWLARLRRPAAAPAALAGATGGSAGGHAGGVGGGEAEAPQAPSSSWPAQRLAVADALWGEGCELPGGAEEVLRLAAPMGLSAAASLLLVGAGGGGAALRLAGELGVWVCACESDPGLLAAAARRVQRAGGAAAKKVTAQAWDPAAPAFRRGGFHHAIVIESLHEGNAAAALAGFAQALRPAGQLVVLETVAGPALDPSDPALLAWCRLERRAPPVDDGAQIGAALARLGLDIRVTEDAGARQTLLAVGGWKRHVRALRGQRPAPAQAAALVAEAELWLRRISLLRAGQLRLLRWHAIVR